MSFCLIFTSVKCIVRRVACRDILNSYMLWNRMAELDNFYSKSLAPLLMHLPVKIYFKWKRQDVCNTVRMNVNSGPSSPCLYSISTFHLLCHFRQVSVSLPLEYHEKRAQLIGLHDSNGGNAEKSFHKRTRLR